MSDSKDLHCPFLNRSDQRCAEFFNLDHLQHAFKFCFDRYHACPMYPQLLAERQGRRAFVAARKQAREEVCGQGTRTDGGRRGNTTSILVQVTVPAQFAARRQPQHAAA